MKLLGKSIGHQMSCRRGDSLWKLRWELDILDSSHDFFLIIRFHLQEDLNNVLFNGPWIIQDHYLIVKKWHPDFVSSLALVSSALAWIQLPGLSIVYYNDNALSAISSYIGKPIETDANTALVTRGKFASICVEINLTKPLLGQIIIDGRWQKVEYEGLHIICFPCGCFGHTTECCSIKIAKLKAVVAAYWKGG